MTIPRFVVSALRGGSGKTVLSVGIVAALKARGVEIAPFKKGPDYIDAGWLALAAGRPCYNLDSYLLDAEAIFRSFLAHTSAGQIAVIEGNRGLYDGIDTAGRTSTAELAKQLAAPVILCLDCTKTTRTMAAVVAGCMQFDRDVRISGVILNRVAGKRHEAILRSSIEYHCGMPVLGSVPKLSRQDFPERHMGLVPTHEHEWAQHAIASVAKIATDFLNLDAIAGLARDCAAFPPVTGTRCETLDPAARNTAAVYASNQKVRIGVIKDAAFQFYYPENLEALQAEGSELVFLSPLDRGGKFPEIDALYIGGGFPETHAQALASNSRFRERIKSLAEKGLPIYGECGGLMYLGENLVLDGVSYPMAGVLPVVYGFARRPQGHGYTRVTVDRENPYFAPGQELKGHEFHYSKVLEWRGREEDLVFRMQRGAGFHGQRDGVTYKNVLATYTHLHALGTPGWAPSLARNARIYRTKKEAA